MYRITGWFYTPFSLGEAPGFFLSGSAGAEAWELHGTYMGVSINGGTVSPNGCFIMQNTIKMEYMGTPISGNLHTNRSGDSVK
jgi:hypothetical protein